MYFLIFHFCNLLTFVLNVSCYAETHLTVAIKMLFNNIWVLTELYLISGYPSYTVTYVIGVGSTFSTDGSFNPRAYNICARVTLRADESRAVKCDTPVRGRYVTVYSNTNNNNDIVCEVEVYGPIIPGKCK